MYEWKKLNSKQKYFSLILLIGFLIKYNYIFIRIFYVPSITGILLKNTVLILLFIYYIFPLIVRKKYRIVILLLYFSFTFIFMANYWYNSYLGNYISFNDIITGKGAGRFSLIEVLLKHILRFRDLLFLIDLALLYYFHKNIQKKYNFSFLGKSRKNAWFIPVLIIFLLIGQVYITNFLLGNQNPAELYSNSSSEFVNVYGFIPLYIYEAYINFSTEDLNIIEAEIPTLLKENNLSGEQRVDDDTNIIVIQVESLDNQIIDFEYNGKEVTPFLNQLKQESIYYENIYSQHVNGSFDADLAFLTSLYPVNKNYAFKENDMSQYNSLVKFLNNKGYNSFAFHGNDKNFFHRQKAYPELGFDKFYGREDFSTENKIIEVDESYLGINDYDFFDQTFEELLKLEEPYFSYMITVTSHTPFNFYPSDHSLEEFENLENNLVKDYFNSISFTDKSLEMFYNQLEEEGILDNTLLVIYGDHESEIKEEEYNSGNNFEMDVEVKNPQNIPLFIKYPDSESETKNKTGTITDIAPTILDLMGVEKKPEEFLGNSLLDEKEKPVLFLHEIPQILYKDHLFIKQQEEFELGGYVGNKNNDFNLSPSDKNYINEVIDFSKEIMYEKRKG